MNDKIVLLICLFLLITNNLCAEILAGVSKINITPKNLVTAPTLAGYNIVEVREVSKICRDIYVRVLVLKQGELVIAFTSLDIVGMFSKTVKKIKEKVKINQIIGFTHSHSVPDTLGMWSRRGLTSYKHFIIDNVVKGIKEALNNLQPVNLYFSDIDVKGLSIDTRVPFLKDDTMSVMCVKSLNNKIVSVIVNWAAHPTNCKRNNTFLSPDYPGELSFLIEKEFGCVALFYNGCIGGQIGTAPGYLSTKKGIVSLPLDVYDPVTNEKAPDLGQKRVEIIAKNLFGYFKKALVRQELFNEELIKFKCKEIELPVESLLFGSLGLILGDFLPRELVIVNKLFNILSIGFLCVSFVLIIIIGVLILIFFLRDKNWIVIILVIFLSFILVTLLYDVRYMISKIYNTKSEINYIKFGQLAEIVTIPGEIYPELVIGTDVVPDCGCDYCNEPFEKPIKSFMCAKYKFVFGLTNDMVGYIIPKPLWDFEKPYAYHRKGMGCGQYNEINSLGPNTAKIVIKNLEQLVKEDK